MDTKIHTHQLDMSDALRDYARSHIEDVVTRLYNKQNPRLDIEFSDAVGGREKQCRVTFYVPHGKTLVATASDANPYAAVDLAAEKISREIRRYKEKRQQLERHGLGAADDDEFASSADELEPDEFDRKIEAELS